MGRVVILGTASAVPDVSHENTHFLVDADGRTILVDCPGSPIVRLQQIGIEPNRLTDIILTHFHPDHVSGFAPLLMSLWLLGRKQPLNVYGLQETVERAEKMMELYDWNKWPGFYPVNFVAIGREEKSCVIDDPEVCVYASPVKHLIPTIGLRFNFVSLGKSVTYSCDTEPTPVMERLAEGADVLIHEATGTGVGHTTPERAGEIARKAGARSLYLIHYPPQLVTPEKLLEEARKTFDGPVYVTKDFLSIDL